MFMQICVYSIIWYFVLTTTQQQKYQFYSHYAGTTRSKKKVNKKNIRGKKLQVKRGTIKGNNNEGQTNSRGKKCFFFHLISPYFFRFFFLLQNACDKSFQCQNNATCQSGFTLKGYRCLCPPGFKGELCETGMSLSQYLKWRICETFSWFSMLVWQLSLSWWKWREFVSLYIELNFSKRTYLSIV